MASTAPADGSSSYVDYDALTSSSFSPTLYANKLVLSTNSANDVPIDLSTPLSRVLFDAQEVDVGLDTITTREALPILEYTKQRHKASKNVLESVEEQVKALDESYKRLEREVVERYEAAEQVRLAAERMVQTLRLGRAVQRAAQLARQLEGQVDEVGREGKGGNWRVMAPAANTVLALRLLFGEEVGESLERVKVVSTLRQDVVAPAERALVMRAQQGVREFSMSSLSSSTSGGGGAGSQTFAQTEETKNRTTAALQTLYLLSPTKTSTTEETFDPTLLISALQSYLQTSLTASITSLARALATLPTLDKTLLEISARCQNIVALEALLSTTAAPSHPAFTSQTPTPTNFLNPLLSHLDTPSLPSYFWRSMASQLTAKVNDILARGGVSARTLRSSRERVREAIRECVDRGSRLPVESVGVVKGGDKVVGGIGGWEREAAVMVGSVVGPLGR